MGYGAAMMEATLGATGVQDPIRGGVVRAVVAGRGWFAGGLPGAALGRSGRSRPSGSGLCRRLGWQPVSDPKTALFLAPIFVLLSHRRASQRWQFGAAICLLAAGSLYRLDSYLMAVHPGNGWTYTSHRSNLSFFK